MLARTLALVFSAHFAVMAGAADWTAFRGSQGDGASPETGVFPDSGDMSLRIRWKRPLGSAYSGIVASGDRLLTLYSDGTDDVLIALDATTGTTLWQQPIALTYVGHDGSHTGALATPATGSGLVSALGPRGELVTARVETGEIVWRTHLERDHRVRKPHYGFSASPRRFGDVLVLPLGGQGRAVAGFDVHTGALKWKAATDAVTYQSPIAWPPDDPHAVVVAGNTFLYRLDARDGSVLWQHPHEGYGTRGAYSLSPVPAGPGRLLLAHRDDGSALIELDPASHTVTRQAATRQDVTRQDVTTVWESRSIRNSYALPVYHDGYFYAYSNRFLTCVNAESGESRWRSRAPGDGFPILVDGHLVIQTKQRGLHVARATPKGYEERAALPLFSDHSWTSPSFANGAIYSRSFSEIARIEVAAGPTELPLETSTAPPGRLITELEERLRDAESSEAILDDFLGSHPNSPIVEGDAAHFLYRGPATDVALAGDLPGARREWPMTRLGDTDLFYRSVSLPRDSVISYLFVVDYQPTVDPRNPQRVTSTVYSSEFEPVSHGALEMSWFAMPDATLLDTTSPDDSQSQPGPHGTLTQETLASQVLDRELRLEVYRPPGYDDDGSRRYPVVYLFGGHGALEHGGFPEVLDGLIGNSVQPLIAVFIRSDGFGNLGNFAEMFASELVPFIDSKYRTRASSQARTSVGMGWEALTAAYCTLKRPGIVGNLALQSMYALTAPEGGPPAWLGHADQQPLNIYLDWGKYDLRNSHEAWSMAEDSRRFFEAMRERGYAPVGGEVNAGAGWASWRTRTHRWLEQLLPLEPPD
ncbi:MAG: PQQ-binding-like beta-propeller repeat protein [Acidobacteriota bacterium]